MDIFVGSLPFKLKENDLREIFEKFGEVSSIKIIINRSTGMKKGFGFVVMADEAQAVAAIQALNNTEILGRKIEVKRSEEKKDVPKKIIRKKESPTSKGEENKSHTWTRKLYPKKKKEVVVDYPGVEEKKGKKAKGGGAKAPKNLRVGSRKK